MIPPVCYFCKEQRQDLENLRNHDLEGYFLLKNPEIYDLPENEPIMICSACLYKESESFENSRNSNNRNSIDHVAPPSIDLEVLRMPGELEKLVNDPVIREEIENILNRAMPAAYKKRKILELLPVESQNILNSQRSQNLLQAPSAGTADIIQYLLNDPPRNRTRLARINDSNSTINSNDSISNSSLLANNSLPPAQISARESPIPPSPVINPAPSQQLVNIYESDSSSDNLQQRTRRSRSNEVSRQSNGSAHSNFAAPRRVQRTETASGIERKNSRGG